MKRHPTLLTHRGSPPRGPIMARNSGCCRRAKSALTKDCSPVRLPNCVEGYLLGQRDLSQPMPFTGFPNPSLAWLRPAGNQGYTICACWESLRMVGC